LYHFLAIAKFWYIINFMKRNAAEAILSILAEIITKTEIIFSRASLSQKLDQLEIGSNFDNRCLNRSLKRFEEQGMLKRIKDKGKDYYRLTAKGLKKLNDFRLEKSFNFIGQKWDGFWRLVIFDIPEDKKTVREGLRNKLRHFGFYPLQKSVFVFPYDCEKEIYELADFFELGDNLQIFLVKSLGRKEGETRQFFKTILGDY
jgi:DNA-binding transcriptional regulator PaaX